MSNHSFCQCKDCMKPNTSLSPEAIQAEASYQNFKKETFEKASKYLFQKHGIDLDERRRSWKAHRVLESSLFSGPIVIEELNCGDHGESHACGVYEIPRSDFLSFS